jgi:hypothetical protein
LSTIRNRLKETYQGTRAVATKDAKALIAEQLSRLEDDLRKLKIEFDIFLNGGAKRPPYDTKNRVETTIKRLADERAMPYAQRYLYNSLVARFTAFQNQWRRSMRNREEGLAVPKTAQAKAAASVAPQVEAVKADAVASPQTLAAPFTRHFTCSDTQREAPTVRAMYEFLVEAKRQCGEPPNEVTFETFQQVIANKTTTLRQKHECESVRFIVQVDNGKVNFKAQAEKV